MELKTKGEEVYVSVKKLVAKLSWTVGADFDLAAVFEPKTGEPGLCYFGSLGDLSAFPFMGDRVILPQYGGSEIQFNGETYVVLREGDILGVVDR